MKEHAVLTLLLQEFHDKDRDPKCFNRCIFYLPRWLF